MKLTLCPVYDNSPVLARQLTGDKETYIKIIQIGLRRPFSVIIPTEYNQYLETATLSYMFKRIEKVKAVSMYKRTMTNNSGYIRSVHQVRKENNAKFI